MAKLCVGIVNYLNSKPLAWSFLQEQHADLFEASYHPPARVAALLAEGALDIGLIPAIEVQRIPDLRVLPGLCVAATEEVRSVLLVHRGPIEEVRRVALDANSRTSAALVEILLADRYGLQPEYLPAQPDLEKMLASADAALLIGDPALRVDRERYRILDLAAEWRSLTGKPMVFAVWAVAPGVELAGRSSYFASSLRAGLESLPTLVAQSAEEMALSAEEIRAYLTDNLCFTLGDEQLAGLWEYYLRAHAHGLIEKPRPLTFVR